MKYLLLGILCVLTAVVYFEYQTFFFPSDVIKLENIQITEETNQPLVPYPEFVPYPELAIIDINPITSLNGMEKQGIAQIRYEKVQENFFLSLYPEAYDPLKPPSSKIFNPITSGKEWITDTQFHVCNPYLLIIPTCQQRINPIMIYGGDLKKTLTCTGISIEEIYEQHNAAEWFRRVFTCPDNPGVIRLWMTNAYDAGFHYASIDHDKSENVDLNWWEGETSIVNALHSQSGFFHVGGHGKNNLSPADRNGRVRLLERDVYTKIHIKLWRSKPSSVHQAEEFAYCIVLRP